MDSLESISILEIAQRIVDLQEREKENTELISDKLKHEVLHRCSNISTFKVEISATLESINRLVDEYYSESKADRERVVKRVVAVGLELVIESILYQQNSKSKDRREAKEVLKAIIGRTVEVIGKVLDIAIGSHMYYPFIFKIIKKLFLLSVVSGYFIPVAYYPLYMMSQMSKIPGCALPVVPVSEHGVKVTEKYVKSKVYHEYVMNNGLDVLGECLKHHSQSLSFPEYSTYIIGELKRIRNSPNKNSAWINSKSDSIIKGAREHAQKIEKIREGLSAIDLVTVKKLEEKIPVFTLNIE